MAKEWAKWFYNSPIWKNRRKEILRRDNYTCVYCGGRATEVHHKVELTPENINDKEIALGDSNLESTCHKCHSDITLNRSDVNDDYIFNEDGFVVPRGDITKT